MNSFVHDGEEYAIDNTRKVPSIGDMDENKKIIFVDFNVPEEFHEGFAVHEIEERKLIKKGHTYEFSHNEAQKKEQAFYIKKFGRIRGIEHPKDEERVVTDIFGRYNEEEMREIITIKEEIMPIAVKARTN